MASGGRGEALRWCLLSGELTAASTEIQNVEESREVGWERKGCWVAFVYAKSWVSVQVSGRSLGMWVWEY